MSVTRENTLVVDFGILPVRPEVAKVQQFLEKEIQLQLSEVKNIQLHNIRSCVLIELKDSESASRYQRLHNNKHIICHGDKGFKIPVYVENAVVPVRVLDLPPAMKHTTVIDFLSQYGEVKSVTRERWKNFFPGVYNGVRILHMKLDRPIPSFVTIAGHETSIHYPGMQKTCRQCQKAAHPRKKCSEVTKENSTITSNQSTEAATNPVPQPTSSSSKNRSLLNPAEFPPIDPKQRVPESASQQDHTPNTVPTATTTADDQRETTGKNNDDGDENDDNASSSSLEIIEPPNKRRLKTTLANEKKKICSSQTSLNEFQSSVENRSQGAANSFDT